MARPATVNNKIGIKHQMKKNTLLIILILPIVLSLISCRSSVNNTEQSDDLKGTITISGAWALYPMMIRWSEEFQKLHPEVMFDISAGGAGKGMADAVSGAVDIGMVSREIFPEEIEKGAFWVAVTKDAVFLTINENNPVWEDIYKKGISREILVGIYITGEITLWGQVVDRPEVVEPIHPFTRSDACGAASTWAEYLGGNQEDLLGIGVYGDPGVLDAVIKDPQGIGFNNLNYAFDFDSGLPIHGAKVVPMDINSNGVADPDEIYDGKEAAVNAVAMNNYPSPPARDLNLVTQGIPVGLTRTFIEWILSEGQQYIEEMGYIVLPQGKLIEELNKLEK
jgi:phosphate transport system substrate-binding protein